MQPVWPCAAFACGATASHSFIAPHSSASKWPKVIQRSRSGGMMRLDGVAVEREHLPQPGVEHQRLVAEDEELVEGEAGRRRDVRHEGREAVDAVGDLVDLGFHERSPGVSAAVGAVDIGDIDDTYVCIEIRPGLSIWMHMLVQ